MNSRFLSLSTAITLALSLLSGCVNPFSPPPKRWETTYFDLFDTVTTVVGYAQKEEDFLSAAHAIHDQLAEYHRLYDIYNEYDGLVNLKTVNETAMHAPVKVDKKIMDLLLFCRELYDTSNGKVNAALGSVLSLWHDARTKGTDDPAAAALPSLVALSEAALHTDFESIILDETASTVLLTDPETQLDVGAVAKGFAVEQVCRSAPAGMLINAGGNVRVTGPKPTEDTPWSVGVQNPDGGDFLLTLQLSNGATATSGDYQRAYIVNGIPYHHIIDPDTLYPATYWRAVTVICGDAGLADGLSTALFALSREEGEAMLKVFDAHALWVDQEGQITYSPGFESYTNP